MKKYKIKAQWITNDFITVNRVYDYTAKELFHHMTREGLLI